MPSSIDVVICGSVGLDDIKTPFGEVKGALGGSASYSSVAASYFAKPGMVSIVGEDFPKKHLDVFESKEINLDGLAREGKTFRWQGFYEFDMNDAKTLKTELNSLEHLSATLPDSYADAPFLFLANSDPDVQIAMINKLPKALKVLDTMNFWIKIKRERLAEAMGMVDIVVMNDAEARRFCDEVNLVKAAKQILALGPTYVIIKKGEHGALLFSKDSCFNAPGYPLEALKDPTGAGDSFAGAMIGYLAKERATDEKTLRKAVVYGSTVASFCAEDFSTNKSAHLTQDEIKERYHEFEILREF